MDPVNTDADDEPAQDCLAGAMGCSWRCKDRRYARLHPEALRAKERRKYERRIRRTATVGSSSRDGAV